MSNGWNLDNQTCFLLYKASRQMTKVYKPLLDPLNLTYTQYVTMIALWEKDEQTVSDLGNRLALDSGTLTPMLKNLVEKGYVKRERDCSDERRVRVKLTEKGRSLSDRANHIPSTHGHLVSITEQERLQLDRILAKFISLDYQD